MLILNANESVLFHKIQACLTRFQRTCSGHSLDGLLSDLLDADTLVTFMRGHINVDSRYLQYRFNIQRNNINTEQVYTGRLIISQL